MKKIPQFNLKSRDLIPISQANIKVDINPAHISKINTAANFVKSIKESNQPVYGINTGFGALAGVVLDKNKLIRLQENLIYSHSVGSGLNLPKEIVRTAMFLRANMLSKAHSGVRPILIRTLLTMLNKDMIPAVPETGSVGASGDLSPLAFIARTLLGFGQVYYKNKIIDAKDGLKLIGLRPFKLELKEGLALINGTDVMSASGALTLNMTEYLAKLADIGAAMSIVALQAKTTPFDMRLMKLKPHPGQMTVAKNLIKLLQGYRTTGKKVQDAYSLRCIPQFAGATREGINFAKQIIETEINSISDNPIIVNKPNSKTKFDIVSGGNFHGQAIALALDTLGIALNTMGITSERRLFRLLDDKLSGLSPFLVENPGVNSGLMMLQVLAAALIAENKVLVHPASIQSVPTSASQEDFVSMGMTAANKCRRILDNTLTIIAIELICARQAIELAKYPIPKLLNKFYQPISKRIPYITDDRLFQDDIINMKNLINDAKFQKIVEHEIL
ncbi:MAG: histidine ammonia-lyase [Candidatus Latescibacteria bacterium]|nr:histidine ammonia-lyase [Candidatus Latescibacterota bacterium]